MHPVRKALVGAGLVVSTAAGGMFGAALLNGTSSAQEAPSTTVPANTAPSGPSDRPAFDPHRGGHVGANGTREELLTGDTADKVKAAAVAAVPGGTVDRAETDAEGSPYEAHMTKADGSHVTVKVDSSFKVTNVETDAHDHG
jgi:hypothetical protein